jgi:hypothetical protein
MAGYSSLLSGGILFYFPWPDTVLSSLVGYCSISPGGIQFYPFWLDILFYFPGGIQRRVLFNFTACRSVFMFQYLTTQSLEFWGVSPARKILEETSGHFYI